MRIGVCSDIFLDSYEEKTVSKFFTELENNQAEFLIICGNFSYSQNTKRIIDLISKKIKQTYFVMGNSDYWGSSFEEHQKNVIEYTQTKKNITYLQNSEAIEINENTCIVGVDGWADLHQGKMVSSFSILNEWQNIGDFSNNKFFSVARDKSFQDSSILQNKLKNIDEKYTNIIVVTHYPPWSELINESELNLLLTPFYTNKSIKNIIEDIPKGKNVHVFCGHTHEEKSMEFGNIKAHCCKASFRKPILSKIFEI
jgi:predicted phosphohydrolase